MAAGDKLDKRLYGGKLANAKATLYTVPASTKTYVKSISLCNENTAALTVDILLNNIYILKDYSIAAKDTYILPCADLVINAGELIEGNSGTADKINCIICGRELGV